VEGEEPGAAEYHRRFPAHAAVVDRVFEDEMGSSSEDDGREAAGLRGMEGGNFDPDPIEKLMVGLPETTGSVPHDVLRDTKADPESILVEPGSSGMPEDAGRHRILDEIDHGGMGAVLKGRDPDLGRELAVKVLLEEHRENPELERRYVEEAQILA
jgi:hypothetical protein